MKRLLLAAVIASALASASCAEAAGIDFQTIPAKGAPIYVQLPDGTFLPAQADASGNLTVGGSISASLAGFNATAGQSKDLAVTGTSADTTLPTGADVVITNTGSVDVRFRMQAGAGTALTTDQMIKAGAAVGQHITTQTHISAITASGSSNLNIQGGAGLAAGYGGGGSGGGAVTNAGTFAVQNTAATPAGNNLMGKVGVDQTTPGTTNAVSLSHIGANAVSTGAGAVGTGSARVAVGQDTTTVAGAAPTTTGIYVTGPSAAALATAANQATANASLATIAGAVGSAQPAACTGVIPISQTSSTDLKTMTNTGQICSIVLVAPDAESVSLVQGTGTVCATGIAALIGSTTAANGMALAANGGFSANSSAPWLVMTSTAQHLCLLQSGSGRIAGVITYVDK